jgi:hypothetical protein
LRNEAKRRNQRLQQRGARRDTREARQARDAAARAPWRRQEKRLASPFVLALATPPSHRPHARTEGGERRRLTAGESRHRTTSTTTASPHSMKRAAARHPGEQPAAQRARGASSSDSAPDASPDGCLRGVVAASVGLRAFAALEKLVRARGGRLVPLDVSDRPPGSPVRAHRRRFAC